MCLLMIKTACKSSGNVKCAKKNQKALCDIESRELEWGEIQKISDIFRSHVESERESQSWRNAERCIEKKDIREDTDDDCVM